MNISLRHVELFHAVMTAGSVTEAAALLRSSQPTVSRELKGFERLLGFALFERKARRLFATEQALRLHAEVKRSFAGLHQIARAAQAIRDDVSSHVEVACMPLFAQTLMPKVCARFLREEPSARLSFHALDHAILLQDIPGGRYEFGLVEAGISVDGTHMQEVPIGDEVCVLPAGHRLCGRKVIRPNDLRDECFVSLAADDVYRHRLDRIFDEAGIARQLRIETTTAEAICALVQRGIGVSIVNPISARAYAGQGVEVRRFSVPIPFVIGICRSSSRPVSRTGQKLAQCMLDECRSVQSELQAATARRKA